MSHRLRRILGALLLVALTAGIAVAAPGLVDWTQYKDRIGQVLSDRLGRQVAFDSLEVEPSLPPLVRIRGLRVANAHWGEAPYLMAIDELRVRVDVLQLVQGDTVVPELVAISPRVWLERNAQGQANWTVGAATGGEAASGSDGGLPLIIRDLRVENAQVSYDDRAADLALKAQLALITGQMPEQGEVTLDAKGSLVGEPLELHVDGAPVAVLREASKPYPINGRLTLADTQASLDGSLERGQAPWGLQADVRLAGPTLATLGLGAFPVPESPPYELAGALSRNGGTWRLGQIDAALGGSELRGWSEVELGGGRPMVRADLIAAVLRYADLQPLAGRSEADDREGLVPAAELPSDLLHMADADLRLRVERTEFPVGPLGTVDARLVVRDGRAEARPLAIGFGGGMIRGEVALNARGRPTSADAGLSYEALPLKELFRGTRFVEEVSGHVKGQLYLLGTGATLDELVGSLDGHVALVMDEGSLSGLLLEAANIDVAETLALYVGGDARVPLRCAVMGLDVESGVAKVRRLVVDTRDSVVRGGGSVDLGREAFDLRLEAQGKDISILDPDAPVFIGGNFADPSVSVGAGAALPLIELGLEGDALCKRLTRQVMALGGGQQRPAGAGKTQGE